MTTRCCFFCEQPIAERFSGDTCPNCGAPLPSQTEAPQALQPTSSETLLQLDWPAGGEVSSLLPRQTRSLWPRELAAPGTSYEEPGAPMPAQSLSQVPDVEYLEGRVDSTPTRGTSDVQLERWSQRILYLFFPPVFSMLSRYIFVVNEASPQVPAKRTVTVSTLRIRRDDETLAEARLEGDILEGEPSLGDRVRIRGHYRDNTLIVDEGYNLSFVPTARIKIRAPLPLQRARIAVAVLATLGLAMLCYFFQLLSLFFYQRGTPDSLATAQKYLLHTYLTSAIIFGLLAYLLLCVSGWLVRILVLGLTLVVLLAVYMALGGSSLFHLH